MTDVASGFVEYQNLQCANYKKKQPVQISVL